jgi:hypothetical protein
MKITDGKGKLIRAGLPNMRQALFFAYNDRACLNAGELRIEPETAPKIEPKAKGGKDAREGINEDPAAAEK